MWFLSKHAKQQRQEARKTRFLRAGLSVRRKNRMIARHGSDVRVPAGVLFLWGLFFVTIFYVALFSVFFLIGTPQITGMSETPEASLRSSVETEITGKYLGIFPRRDFFLIRPKKLEEHLLSEYPLLASADVTRVFPDGMRIEVTERKKILLWCSGEFVQNGGDTVATDRTCHLIDEEGRAQESSRALLPENIPYVLFITDTSGKPVATGEKVFDPSYGVFVIQANESFPKQLGLAFEPRFTAVSRFANELRMKTNEGWEVYVSSEIPIESSLNALRLLFEKELPQEKRAKLAYIDLRAENRVYYAFREGENMEDSSDASPSEAAEEKKTDTESKKKEK